MNVTLVHLMTSQLILSSSIVADRSMNLKGADYANIYRRPKDKKKSVENE